jgi:hypothetical protein
LPGSVFQNDTFFTKKKIQAANGAKP